MSENQREGWGNPRPFSGRSKFHYFIGGQSLCNKWGFYTGDIEQGMDDHSDNCPTCMKKKKALGTAQQK